MDEAFFAATGILDDLAVGIIVTDTNGTIHYLNEPALVLLELEDKPATLFDAVAPFESWRSLLDPDAHADLYLNSGRLEVRTRAALWNGEPMRRLMLARAAPVSNGWHKAERSGEFVHALARISRRLRSTLNLSDVVSAVLSEAVDCTMASGGQLHMLDSSSGRLALYCSKGLALRAAIVDQYNREIQNSHCGVRESLLPVEDGVRTVLITPILYEGVVAGTISIFRETEVPLSEEAESFLSALADHVGVAIGNSRRYDELNRRTNQLQRRTDQIERFVQSGRALRTDEPLGQVYDDLVYSIQEGVGFRFVILNLIEDGSQEMVLRCIAAAGLPLERLNELQQLQYTWEEVSALFRPEYSLGAAYFVPAELAEIGDEIEACQGSDLYQRQEKPVGEPEKSDSAYVYAAPGSDQSIVGTLSPNTQDLVVAGLATPVDGLNWLPISCGSLAGWVEESLLPAAARNTNQWHEDDLFVIPLWGAQGEPIGLISLDGPDDGQRPSMNTAKALEIFASQASVAIQNARLVAKLRELNEDLDDRVADRTHALGQERDRVTFMLRISSELSASLEQERVLSRALELVNEVVQATSGGIVLIDGAEEPARYHTAVHQATEVDGVSDALTPVQRDLVRWIVRHGTPVVCEDLRSDSEWSDLLQMSDVRSVLAVPLIINDDVAGVLCLFHEEPAAFSQEQFMLVEAASRQLANAVSNAQLYLLIRDQAEKLGTMLREEQIEAAKNQAILESIADGVLVAGAEGRIVLANVAAATILKIPSSDLLGKSLNELLGLFDHKDSSWLEMIKSWSTTGGANGQHTLLANRLSLESSVVSAHVAPVVTNGRYIGTVSIFRDVTKEVEADRMKNEFVSTVSHELRTPMTSIKGYAELMLMGGSGRMTEAQIRYLQVIKDNADRLSQLVNDLLDISRIETGKTELVFEALDLPAIVDQVVEGHLRGRVSHEGKPLEVAVDLEPDLPQVFADHRSVLQILTNLVDNAFHYTPPDGQIVVSASANGDCALIHVQDTGIGIGSQHQNKIFERFYRAQDELVQRVSGTGLGLAIVRSLVEKQGGQIWVDSTLGEGSTFTFSLPLAAAGGREP